MTKLRNLVSIERKRKLGKIYGFLISKSKNWLLVESEGDFQTDGYRVVARKDVKTIRHGSAEKLHQVICKKMGAVPGPSPKVPFEDPERLFHVLRSKAELVIIECERKGDWSYTIGKIEGISRTHVQVTFFNVAGKFEKVPREIAYRHISQIGFSERYIKGYSAYFKWKKEKRLRV